jgi:hypothetical protein
MMNYMRGEPESNSIKRWSWQLALALIVLVGVVIFSVLYDDPVRLIYPYALSVGLVAWKHGLLAGFIFSAFATLAALWCGAFPTHPTSTGHEATEGLITYAQLSFVCVIIWFARRAEKKLGH